MYETFGVVWCLNIKNSLSSCLEKHVLMSEKELNKYRLTSLEEPTDEMLSQIMQEIAAEVTAENREAERLLMQQLREAVAKDKQTEEA